MKNLDEMLNEALADVNESKIDYTLQLCQDDGTVEETTTISFDTHGKSMEEFYFEMPSADQKRLEKEAHKILVDAHKKDRDIVKICIVYEPDGDSETLDVI